MKKIKIKVNLGDIQDKIWGTIVNDFSIQDLKNAKQEWIDNLIECRDKQVGDEALINDLCNFLKNIEFEEEKKQKETEFHILLKNGKKLILDNNTFKTLYMKYLELTNSKENILDFVKMIEDGKIKIFVGDDIEELLINYCFCGKYSDELTSVTYKNADILYDIHKILNEYAKVLNNNGVDIISINEKKYILEV